MMVKVISGFLDLENNKIIEKGTQVDFTKEKAEKLINLGLVVELPAAKAPAKKAATKKAE